MHLEPCVDEKWWNHISLLRVLQVDADDSLMSTASDIIEESLKRIPVVDAKVFDEIRISDVVEFQGMGKPVSNVPLVGYQPF
jgi:hypothetical protein